MSSEKKLKVITMNSSIDIATPEGSFYAYVAEPAALPAPAIVVIQEAFGVNADLRATCDELAAKGFIAVCPDLYWRQEPMLQLSATADWTRAFALYQALDIDKAVADVRATVNQTRELKNCTGKVGVTGFCLGGLLTYLTAVRGGVDAGVSYYGGRTEEFLGEGPQLSGPLMMHLGEQDEYISSSAQSAIRAELAPRGVEIHTYPGCSHAFARHQGEHYDAGAAAQANARTVAFLQDHLRA
jgi:carboxymethylenebutenolidase